MFVVVDSFLEPPLQGARRQGKENMLAGNTTRAVCTRSHILTAKLNTEAHLCRGVLTAANWKRQEVAAALLNQSCVAVHTSSSGQVITPVKTQNRRICSGQPHLVTVQALSNPILLQCQVHIDFFKGDLHTTARHLELQPSSISTQQHYTFSL